MSHHESDSQINSELDSKLADQVTSMKHRPSQHPNFAHLESRILSQLNQEEISVPESKKTTWFNPRSWFSLPRLGIASSGLFGLVAVIVMISGTTQTSFANVLKQIQQINTLIMTSTTQVTSEQLIETVVYFQQPNLYRVENMTIFDQGQDFETISFIDRSEQKLVVIHPHQKVAMKTMIAEAFQNMNAEPDPLFWLNDLKNLQANSEYTDLGQAEIDGRMTKGYKIQDQGLETVIWADIHTHIPVRFEVRRDELSSEFALNDFEVIGDVIFNPELDPSLFDSSSIPDTYQIIDVNADEH